MDTKTQTPGADYKRLLLDAKKMMGRSGVAAYKRIELLVRVFEDVDFLTDFGNADDLKASAYLDDFLEDLVFRFLDLRALFLHFPEESDWKDGNLRTMFETMRQANRKQDEQSEPRTVRSATVKQLDEANLRADEAEAVNLHVKRQMDRQESEVEALKKTVEELQLDKAQLIGRIEELERMLKFAPVGAGA